jgi:protocatechuate 3,4-dioxygenase beta subunit
MEVPVGSPSGAARSAVDTELLEEAVAPSDSEEIADAAAPATGLLTGRVVDESGEPITGVRVGARFLATREFSMLDLEAKHDEREVAVDVTDDEGHFELEVPAAHPVDLDARRTGFGTAYERGLYAGEKRDVVLRRAASFTGRVVRADDGRPVPDVPLRGWSTVTRAEIFQGESGPDGSFRFEDLPPGPLSYEVEPHVLAAPEWVTVELVPGELHECTIRLETGMTVFGRVSDATTGAAIEGAEIWEGWFGRKRVLAAADGTYRLEGFGGWGVSDVHVHAPGYGNVTHDFHSAGVLLEDVEHNFELVPARRARGRVIDGTGSPVQGAYVAAVHSSFVGAEQVTDWEAARTDAAGQYVLPSLHRGVAHVLFVRKRGFGTVVYGFPADEFDVAVVVLPDVALPAPGRLEGVVVDELGEPRLGVKMVLKGWNADSGALSSGAPRVLENGLLESYIGEREAATDSRGRFAFTDLSGGTYQLRAKAAGGGDGLEREVEIEEGGWVRGLEIVLPRGLSIAGRVVDSDGSGVPQAIVSAKSEETGEEQTAVAGGGGAFELLGLGPGRYRLIVNPVFVERGEGSPTLAESIRRGVEPGGDPIELVLPVAVRVEGTVLGADGAPFYRAFVYAHDTDDRQVGWAVTDKSGGFTFDLAPGEPLRVEASPTQLSETSPVGVDPVGTKADWAQLNNVTAPASGLTLQLPAHSSEE